MKRVFNVLIFLFCMVAAYAQTSRDLLVSEIKNGTVHWQMGKEKIALKRGKHIMVQDILFVSNGAIMVLLEPGKCRRYTVKGPYTGTVRNYIQRNEQSCAFTVTRKYMNYLLSQALSDHKYYSGKTEDDHATVYRKSDTMIDDSVSMSLRSIDSLYHTIDSLTIIVPDTVQSEPVENTK